MITRKVFLNVLYGIALCLVLSSSKLFATNKDFMPVSGTLDLSSWDFASMGPIALEGDWTFHWNQLVPPDSLVFLQASQTFRTFDLLWSKDSKEYLPLNQFGYATYSLKISINKHSPDLSLFIPDFYSAYALYLNGKLIAKNGKVGKSKQSSEPHWLPLVVDLPEIKEEAELVLHISNFRHSKGGASKNIVLGETGQIRSDYNKEVGMDLILSGCLIMTAFFFLGLYWFGKHEMQLLFFAMYSLMYSYRIFGFGIYAFHQMFPGIPWIITLRVEYLTLFLSTLFFICYSYQLYKEETSLSIVRVTSALCLIFSLITILFPPSIFTQLVGPFFIVLLIGFAYVIYTYCLAVYNKKTGSVLSLIGTSVVLLVFGYNILVYFGIAPDQKILTAGGYFLFFFIQSVILFNLHTVKLNQAKVRAETISNSKTEFLSTISHEMRTPLNAVIGLTNYLINDNPKDDHVADLKSLKHSADNLNFLINDVLDYSKIEAGKIVFDYIDTNIYELVENLINSLEPKAKEKGIELKYVIDKAIPKMIVCDGFRLNQVLTNLIGNAIKFTKSGSVELRLKKIQIVQKKVKIKFFVNDTGIGISKNQHQTIFDNYIQASSSIAREFGGTGLGLAITKKILDLQGTKIQVSSVLGKGSQFYFTQEFSVSEVQEPSKEIVYKEMEGFDGKVVLLVEDNPVNIMIETKFLARWNIKVDVAQDGLMAIEKAKSNDYDLILMDLRMPVMDGYEATKELRKIGINVPIIAVTASGISNVGQKLFNAGMNDFIKKPFDPDEMYVKVKKYLSLPKEQQDITPLRNSLL